MYLQIATALVIVSALDMVAAIALFLMLVGTRRVVTKMKNWKARSLYMGLPLLVVILAIVGMGLKDLGPGAFLAWSLLFFNIILQMFSFRLVLDEEDLRRREEVLKSKAKAFDSEPYEPSNGD
jgi:hypothetical protein